MRLRNKTSKRSHDDDTDDDTDDDNTSEYLEHRERKRLRYPITDGLSFASIPIIVVVGKSKERFYVHEEHIRARSSFFDKILERKPIDKSHQAVDLVDIKPFAFAIYVKWLYSGRFYISEDGSQEECQEDGEEDEDAVVTDLEIMRWQACYVLADTLDDVDFKDALIDMIIDRMYKEEEIWPQLVHTIYPHSWKESPHRQFATDCALSFWNDDDFTDFLEGNYCEEFKNDLIQAMSGHLRRGLKMKDVVKWVGSLDPCDYHEHTLTDAPCYKTTFES